MTSADITWCVNPGGCEVRGHCCRHAYRQAGAGDPPHDTYLSWSIFFPAMGRECPGYWPAESDTETQSQPAVA